MAAASPPTLRIKSANRDDLMAQVVNLLNYAKDVARPAAKGQFLNSPDI
ncbi:hypothetical protein [Sphingomonas sp. LaA6.9]|nr:hypothetical protein [Sphingomonas sp. LaA6.9]MCJ8158031.1 hypothetical protein [Sphingomonas sp. LaA6.9]